MHVDQLDRNIRFPYSYDSQREGVYSLDQEVFECCWGADPHSNDIFGDRILIFNGASWPIMMFQDP